MKTFLYLSALAVLSLVAVHAGPMTREMPTKSVASLEKVATHVITGKVQRVWTSKEKEGRHTYLYAVAELQVEEAKANGEDGAPGKGELVYVRWFTRSWNGPGAKPAESNGHYGWTPKGGDRVRAYVARNAYDGWSKDNDDGGFNVVFPNGFVELTD